MDFEFYILDYIQSNFRTELLDKIMPIVSFMGKLSWIWVVIAIVCLFTKKFRRLGISLSSDLIFNLIAGNLIIKTIVARPRPCTLNKTVELISSVPFDTSFPSGHTLSAFGAATIIFIYNKWLGIIAYLFAFIMAFSRLYLYVHFPTDILFGAIFGITFAVISYFITKPITNPQKLKLVPKY